MSTKWLAVVAAIVGVQAPAQSAWTVSEWDDAITDEKRKVAAVVSDEGHRLLVYRAGSSGSEAWATFSVNKQSYDLIDYEKLITYRIDQHPAVSLQAKKRPIWKPTFVQFPLGIAKSPALVADTIYQLMGGSVILVRYHLSDGLYKDTRFSLNGSRATIAEALNIPQFKDHEAITALKRKNAAAAEVVYKFQAAVSAESEKCESATWVRTCTDYVRDCERAAKGDRAIFGACIEKR